MDYSEVNPISRKGAEAAFASSSKVAICDALVRIAFHEKDRQWAQDQCLMFSSHEDADIRGLAVTCLGHLARIHGYIDREKVIPVLKLLLNDSEIVGRVEDALSDIKMYAKSDDYES